ncbi:MAG: hypothetical protein F6K31_12695 [Symploca sp. SIO2G7]|nr:hypothetical protein [Symploca sp. SIO2G7]
MKTYVISLVILVLSGTNALAANSSYLSVLRHDLKVSKLIDSPTAQILSNKATQRSATVDHQESTPMIVANKLGDTQRGSPDSRPDNQSE